MKQLKKGPDIKKKLQGCCSSRASGHGKGPDPSLTSHVHSNQQCPQEAEEAKEKASFSIIRMHFPKVTSVCVGRRWAAGFGSQRRLHCTWQTQLKQQGLLSCHSRLLPLSLRDLVHLQGLPLVNYSRVKIPASPQHPLHSPDLTTSQLLELLGSEALTPAFLHVIPPSHSGELEKKQLWF